MQLEMKQINSSKSRLPSLIPYRYLDTRQERNFADVSNFLLPTVACLSPSYAGEDRVSRRLRIRSVCRDGAHALYE